MHSKTQVRRHVEKAFEFMTKTISSDGRGGRPAMEWHADRLIKTMQGMPAELIHEALQAAKSCALKSADEVLSRDAKHLYELFEKGLKNNRS